MLAEPFILSMLATLGLVTAYVAIPLVQLIFIIVCLFIGVIWLSEVKKYSQS